MVTRHVSAVAVVMALLTISGSAGATEFAGRIDQQLRLQASREPMQLLADEFKPRKPKADQFRPAAVRTGRKSALKAGLLSFVVPGAGQWYLGAKKRSSYYFAAEGAIWGSFAAFSIYSDWKDDDARRLGESRAGAQLEGKDDQFLDLVGFYESVDEYNTLGRIIEPTRPYYLPTDPSTYWRWESNDDRETFKQLKNQSREATRRAEFMLGAAILNRIVSTIDAVFTARRSGGAVDGLSLLPNTRLEFHADPLRDDPTLSFVLHATVLP